MLEYVRGLSGLSMYADDILTYVAYATHEALITNWWIMRWMDGTLRTPNADGV